MKTAAFGGFNAPVAAVPPVVVPNCQFPTPHPHTSCVFKDESRLYAALQQYPCMKPLFQYGDSMTYCSIKLQVTRVIARETQDIEKTEKLRSHRTQLTLDERIQCWQTAEGRFFTAVAPLLRCRHMRCLIGTQVVMQQ
jgi:hypothetical protein